MSSAPPRGPLSRPRSPGWQRVWLWGPVVAYCGLIFALSSVSDVPSLPGGMSDKTGHMMLYAGLGALVARALGACERPAARTILGAALGCAAYGLSDECHQLFVPLRTFDLLDLAADVAGGACGAGAVNLWGIIAAKFTNTAETGRSL